MAEISDLISGLQKSGLDAECPKCGKSSSLSNWLLFDGLKSFPNDAEQKIQEMEEVLQTDWDKLKKADQVQFFAECLSGATHPGNLREIVTKFKSWKESLPKSDQQVLGEMFIARNKELKGE